MTLYLIFITPVGVYSLRCLVGCILFILYYFYFLLSLSLYLLIFIKRRNLPNKTSQAL